MNVAPRPKIVLLGIMTRHPVGGVIWQTLHYLEGLRRLGFDVHYVESGGHQPSALLVPDGGEDGDRSAWAAAFLARTLEALDLGDRWAFHALHADGRCYGMSEGKLKESYRSAELIINLHGATLPTREQAETGRLVYLETDPVWIQIELYRGLKRTADFLDLHSSFFTFGENYGRQVCALPVDARYDFRPTRQPVVMDFWEPNGTRPGSSFTTVGNWKQKWRDVEYRGEIYRWSKHHEFLKFLDLPTRTGASFELALSPRGCDEEDRRRLEEAGWSVRNALDFSTDPVAYRSYIQRSLGEFTVAKDQNVRFRTGWFSDRSATYLASGRPVLTQDTGFGAVLPIGEGLIPFLTEDEAEAGVDALRSDYPRHARAAREIAREWFAHDVVLPRLLEEAGVSCRAGRSS
jgi:hypothetical protein